jgi:hypothetical protein
LCDWCAFKAYCPAWGGDPAAAVELRPVDTEAVDADPTAPVAPVGSAVERTADLAPA